MYMYSLKPAYIESRLSKTYVVNIIFCILFRFIYPKQCSTILVNRHFTCQNRNCIMKSTFYRSLFFHGRDIVNFWPCFEGIFTILRDVQIFYVRSYMLNVIAIYYTGYIINLENYILVIVIIMTLIQCVNYWVAPNIADILSRILFMLYQERNPGHLLFTKYAIYCL